MDLSGKVTLPVAEIVALALDVPDDRLQAFADRLDDLAYDDGGDDEILHLYEQIEKVLENRAREHEQTEIDEREWSDNQRAFISQARALGLEVTLYSGRGMYGEECPAVPGDVHTTNFAADVYHDSLGLGAVVYARH